MWLELFVIGAWLTITPMSAISVQYEPDSIHIFTDTTSVILVEFNENMSVEGLRDVNKYVLKDESNKIYNIYKIGIVNVLDSIVIRDTSVVVLITERLEYRKEYTVTVTGVKDKAGNFIQNKNTGWFFYNGYAPNKFITPIIDMTR